MLVALCYLSQPLPSRRPPQGDSGAAVHAGVERVSGGEQMNRDLDANQNQPKLSSLKTHQLLNNFGLVDPGLVSTLEISWSSMPPHSFDLSDPSALRGSHGRDLGFKNSSAIEGFAKTRQQQTDRVLSVLALRKEQGKSVCFVPHWGDSCI